MVTQEKFIEVLLPELPEDCRERALKIFTDFGEYFYNDIANTLVNSLEYKRVPLALEKLEKLYEEKVKGVDEGLHTVIAYELGVEYFPMINNTLLTE